MLPLDHNKLEKALTIKNGKANSVHNDRLKSFGIKFISFFVSLKVYLLALTTVLLCKSIISETTWSTVILSIALSRVAIQGISAVKASAYPKDFPKKLDNSDIID